jgi:hypothetical protein
VRAPRLPRLIRWLGGWPRRLAALACLLLAAASALSAPKPAASQRPSGPAAELARDEVAVPVAVSAASAALVRSGNRIGVLAAPGTDTSAPATLVADRLRVLSVHADDQVVPDGGGAVVVVAARRPAALALARVTSDRLVLIVDDLP